MDIEELCNACARGDMDKVVSSLNLGAHVNGINKYNRRPIQVGRDCCFDRSRRVVEIGLS